MKTRFTAADQVRIAHIECVEYTQRIQLLRAELARSKDLPKTRARIETTVSKFKKEIMMETLDSNLDKILEAS